MKFIPFLISIDGHFSRQLIKLLKNAGFLVSGLLIAKGQSAWEPIVSGLITLAIAWFEYYLSAEANHVRINTRDELVDLKADSQVSSTPADKPTEVLPMLVVPPVEARVEIPGLLRYPLVDAVTQLPPSPPVVESHTVSYDVDGMPMTKVFSSRYDAVMFRNSKPGAMIL